jgi:predicted GIY-YIG superfamily endonuclease
MQLVTLEEIATIRAAVIFREKAPIQSQEGNVCALTIKDIVASWPVISTVLPRIEVAANMLSNCLVGGEVLIPARGDNYPARYFQAQEEAIFPYGQINIISPSERILGRYLSWYINQPKIQDMINQSLTGTGIKALVRARLLELRIKVPSLDIQNAIAELQKLREESKAIKERLITLEEQEIEWNCRKLLSEDINENHV